VKPRRRRRERRERRRRRPARKRRRRRPARKRRLSELVLLGLPKRIECSLGNGAWILCLYCSMNEIGKPLVG